MTDPLQPFWVALYVNAALVLGILYYGWARFG